MLPFLYTRIRKDTTIHTCHILLVEADDPEQAFRIVADKLDEGTPSWSDWHEVDFDNILKWNFAGRWTGEVFMTPEQLKARSEKQEVDLSENPNYLRFSDDPALADEVIQKFLDYRLNEIENIKNTLRTDYPTLDLFTYDYSPYSERDFSRTMGLYYIKNLTDIYSNVWTPNTYVYDLEQWDATLNYFFERVAKDPTKQFLIPVDFHH